MHIAMYYVVTIVSFLTIDSNQVAFELNWQVQESKGINFAQGNKFSLLPDEEGEEVDKEDENIWEKLHEQFDCSTSGQRTLKQPTMEHPYINGVTKSTKGIDATDHCGVKKHSSCQREVAGVDVAALFPASADDGNGKVTSVDNCIGESTEIDTDGHWTLHTRRRWCWLQENKSILWPLRL